MTSSKIAIVYMCCHIFEERVLRCILQRFVSFFHLLVTLASHQLQTKIHTWQSRTSMEQNGLTSYAHGCGPTLFVKEQLLQQQKEIAFCKAPPPTCTSKLIAVFFKCWWLQKYDAVLLANKYLQVNAFQNLCCPLLTKWWVLSVTQFLMRTYFRRLSGIFACSLVMWNNIGMELV